VIHSVGFAMQQLGFKLLNDITWVKPNPPPNLSCRYFTHATETIIWAAKNKKSRHTFHYRAMKEQAGGKQMKSVWEILPPEREEKRFGKHPTQKPVALLERILLASSNPGDLILDPFLGSGTTAVAAVRLSRFVLGVEQRQEPASLTVCRVCSELAQVVISVFVREIHLDLLHELMDRSVLPQAQALSESLPMKLVHQERSYYFVGLHRREVIYSIRAATIEEAWQKFHDSREGGSEVIFVIKTETEVYLAPGK
jgi:hypothetical protein